MLIRWTGGLYYDGVSYDPLFTDCTDLEVFTDIKAQPGLMRRGLGVMQAIMIGVAKALEALRTVLVITRLF